MTGGTWRFPRAVFGREAETCAEQVLRASPVIQSRIGRGTKCGGSDDVSRETILRFGQLTPVVPILVVILRCLRRRISARGEWVGLDAGRFFTDSITALVRQNDKVKAEWDMRRPNENPHKKPFVS
ncbi:MAG: hypothetical protein II779_10745, partial [Clostridia bacterium]|nr:hypothetical protein [Clostridia bacterium]